MSVRILHGDCRQVLRTLSDASVHCCVTSPPYFGLRDYGHAGQIGLEPTPAEYVAQMVDVFREVRRVLRDDGTLWLNLGDSYATNGGAHGGRSDNQNGVGGKRTHDNGAGDQEARRAPSGLKPKDLIGIPWAVATALRDPYYTGRITRERDRTWLAAMLDGEGTICGFHHVRADTGDPRTGVHITITNSNVPLLDEAHRIWPTSRSDHGRPGPGHLGKRATFRWIVHGAENKLLFLREVYPYLIAKKRQALVAFNLLLMFANAKSVGHSAGRDAAREKRAFLASLLSDLNQCRPVDLPSWLVEPPSVFEPGWYLRQDIIWSKPNPMPESVTDRCTKAHEYVFMLSKSARYFYDQDAIKEHAIYAGLTGQDDSGYKDAQKFNGKHAKTDKQRGHSRRHAGFNERWDAMDKAEQCGGMRNKRSVWTIATQPFSEAHFATMAPELAETCIKAGCPEGGTVLDPFGGAGTTGLVADRLQRSALLIELNPAYAGIADRRIVGDAPLFANVEQEPLL